MNERLMCIISESIVNYMGHDLPYHVVCRAKHSLTRSSADGCSRSPLLEWAQALQSTHDKENMEPATAGSAYMQSWPEDLNGRPTWVVSHVLSMEDLEFSTDIESVKGNFTHVTCSAPCTIYYL